MEEKAKNQKIAMTTTNGTLAIDRAKTTAHEVLVASFSNLSATANYLAEQENDVLIICAGWKGRPGLEDILFAGALVKKLGDAYINEEDSTHLATAAYEASENDMLEYLQRASHLKRLKTLGGDDIPFCLIPDQFDVVVHLVDDELCLK
jgi:2-phosphosulfolactate phosphatase